MPCARSSGAARRRLAAVRGARAAARPRAVQPRLRRVGAGQPAPRDGDGSGLRDARRRPRAAAHTHERVTALTAPLAARA
eukprot:1140507-Prymnesium_polylepis.3